MLVLYSVFKQYDKLARCGPTTTLTIVYLVSITAGWLKKLSSSAVRPLALSKSFFSGVGEVLRDEAGALWALRKLLKMSSPSPDEPPLFAVAEPTGVSANSSSKLE